MLPDGGVVRGELLVRNRPASGGAGGRPRSGARSEITLGRALDRDPVLGDDGHAGPRPGPRSDGSVSHAGPDTAASSSYASGSKPLEVGEAPRLVRRRRQLQLLRYRSRRLPPPWNSLGRVPPVQHDLVAVRDRARNAMWQTPVSRVSPWNCTPFASSSSPRLRDVRRRASAKPGIVRAAEGATRSTRGSTRYRNHVVAEPELGETGNALLQQCRPRVSP